jgi:hypothetical protein
MKKNKQSSEQIKSAQIEADKRFSKRLTIGFISVIFLAIAINITVSYWCEIKFIYREKTNFGKAVSPDFICMSGDKMGYHKTTVLICNEKQFYVCSDHCSQKIKNHFQESAFTNDALSGKQICKADALIGLKTKNRPAVVYFENAENLKKYYQIIKKKSIN